MTSKAFKKSLLASTGLLVSIVLLSPVRGMEPDEGETVFPKTMSSSQSSAYVEEEGQKEHPFDIKTWGKSLLSLLMKKEEISELLSELEGEACKGNIDAQEKLYDLSLKPFLGVQCVDGAKGQEILNSAFEKGQSWSCKKVISDLKATEERKIKAHLELYNCGDNSVGSEAFLDKKFDFEKEINELSEKIKNEKNRNKRDNLISEYREKLKKTGYAKFFLHIFLSITCGVNEGDHKLRETSAELGHLQAMFESAYWLQQKGGEGNLRKAEKWYRQAAEKGHLNSIRELVGLLFYKGNKESRDEVEKWLRIAVQKEDSDLQYKLGVFLQEKGGKQNLAEAEEWYRKAVRKGNLAAMNNLATLLREKKQKEAEKLYRQAADQGHIEATYNLGRLLHEKGGKQNLAEAEKLYRKAGENGHLIAMNNLGLLLYNKGDSKNRREGKKWLRMAVEKGHLEATYNLAKLLHEKGGKQNLAEAEELYRKAAEQGHLVAMSNLGFLLYEKGGDKNRREAEKWLREAAAKGDVIDLVNLGAFLFLMGGNENQKEAEKCFREGAKKGNFGAEFNLGAMLHQKGGEENLREAEEWYEKAAKKDSPLAMTSLGRLYLERESKGQEKSDLVKAIFWLEKANSLGEKSAKVFLEQAVEKEKEGQGEETVEEDQKLEKAYEESLQMIQVNKKRTAVEKPLALSEVESSSNASSKESSDSDEGDGEDTSGVDLKVSELERKDSESELPNKKKLNVKGLREQLRKAKEAYDAERCRLRDAPKRNLLKPSVELIAKLRDEKGREDINEDSLRKLFCEDPYFDSQVNIKLTKSGIMLTATNLLTGAYHTASTHRNHNKTYKGYNPNFFKEIDKILGLFNVK
jgi:TPR repeat protein